MSIPTESDWGFRAIREVDPNRADRLENAGTLDRLVETLREELRKACQNDEFRLGVDSLENKFEENRVIIQFKVQPETYDWFFNARTGYRAQFWSSPENGITFNQNLILVLRDTFLQNIAPSVLARRIKVIKTGDSREDWDAGETTLTHQRIRRSLDPNWSKIWICERLIQPNRPSKDIGRVVLYAAEQDHSKLHIPRWDNNEDSEGLRAPYPDPEYSWLDIKGAFVLTTDKLHQEKPPEERAEKLYKTGWT